MASKELEPPTYKDVVGCQAVLYEWAESFDSKDWDRLSKCLAPSLYVDYREVMGSDAMGPGMLWEAMPASDFVALASSPGFLGNPRIQTQHFVGAIKWEQTSDSGITASHQMRVAHQKYKDDELKEVAFRGHAYGWAFTRYSNVDGVWKLAGVGPDLRWTEHNYDKIFQVD